MTTFSSPSLRFRVALPARRVAATGTFAIALSAAASARADVPTYTGYVLQARMNVASNTQQGVYDIPAGYFLKARPLHINNRGDVTFSLGGAPSGAGQALWYRRYDQAHGALGYVATIRDDGAGGDDTRIGDATLNNAGDVAFALGGFTTAAASDGIYVVKNGSPMQLVKQASGSPAWDATIINDVGQIACLTSTSSRTLSIVSSDGAMSTIIATETVSASNPYNYLYTPSFNNVGAIASRVSLPSPADATKYLDEIVVWSGPGAPTVVARQTALDPASQFASFSASAPGLNDAGHVSFVGTLAQGGKTGVFLYDGTTIKTVALVGNDGLTEIESFPTSVNNQGVVVFRAKFASGKAMPSSYRAVFVGDGTSLRRVVSERDVLPSDKGPVRVDHYNDPTSPDFPVFDGSPSINDRGDVAFAAVVTATDNPEIDYGDAVYVATADGLAGAGGVAAGAAGSAGQTGGGGSSGAQAGAAGVAQGSSGQAGASSSKDGASMSSGGSAAGGSSASGSLGSDAPTGGDTSGGCHVGRSQNRGLCSAWALVLGLAVAARRRRAGERVGVRSSGAT